MNREIIVALVLWGCSAWFCTAGDQAGKGAAEGVPPGAAALGYTKCVMREAPTAADIAPGRNGNYKWFSGQWYSKTPPSLDHYETQNGTLAIKLGGNLVSTPLDFSAGRLPLLPGADGFYVEFDVRLSDNDRDHWPAVWLMPAEHDGKHDHYEGDPAGYERFMELDVDEGGFGPGLTGTVHSTEGVYPKWKHIQNPNNVSHVSLDRSQQHTFGAGYDPVQQKVTWWIDGRQQMSAGAPYVPAVAARQHFYLILSGQSHGAKKLHLTFLSGVRAYVPPTSPLPAVAAVNYARPYEPPTRQAFIPLPPGAVEPGGWLRDWCLAARDGYTGHMDEVHQEFQRAWAVDHKMTGQQLSWPKGGWPYEGGGYWFDGLTRLGRILHDDALIQQAKRRFNVVVDNMNPNSILFLWWLDKTHPDDLKSVEISSAWPIWACGLLGRGLAAHYAGAADPRVLQTLETAYGGDHIWAEKGWGMSNAWPAFETYTWTGSKEIAAALTTLFSKDGREKNSKADSWSRYRRLPDDRPGAERNDHGVHFLECTTPWALGYLWTGNREFLDAAMAWHDMVARDSMQPHGVIVSDEHYWPTGAFRGTETCNVAGYLWSQIVLLTISGQGRLADRTERAFFNAGPATVARDFKTHVYFQTPNRFVDNSPPCPEGPRASGCSYKKYHFPLCCTAALNRILPNYVMHMWMATYDNGLAATHYGPCRVAALVTDHVPVEIECRTDYPFNEKIDMVVKPARNADFPLSFRIPGWCTNPSLTLNGSDIQAASDANGFVRIERRWKQNDTIRLRFPMVPRVATGRDANAAGAPFAAVSYGPLLFALPIPDTDKPNTPAPAARWKYALDLLHEKPEAEIAVERQPMPATWDWPFESPLKLRASAVAIDWNPPPTTPRLPPEPIARRQPVERITLIPYGCTKFRISMFPVTAKAGTLGVP